jgi:asparaginyl-tRNA synthetase
VQILFCDINENIKKEFSACIKVEKKRKNLYKCLECEVFGGYEFGKKYDFTSEKDVLSEYMTNHILNMRHMYMRNSKIKNIMKARCIFLDIVRTWFVKNEYIEINAPVITPIPLYEDKTAIRFELFGENLFLTQCVSFYLESCMFGLERVYNIGPSFRAETSKSRRHLSEYWHIKFESAFTTYSEIFYIVEDLISYVITEFYSRTKSMCDELGVKDKSDYAKKPFKRIDYVDAIKICNESGYEIKYGDNMNAKAEEILSKNSEGFFWIVKKPKELEPFPYKVDDEGLALVADLIAPNGYGELLGIAEKIYDYDELLAAMNEHNKDCRYDWVADLRKVGSIPHSAMGMGVERFLRWLLQLDHVKHTIPFPRLFGRHTKI